MDYIWIAVAFSCGFIAKQINLPPLVGYLAAGFGLHALGVEPDSSLETFAKLGVELLLFTIGLKLDIKNLFKTEIWGTTIAHMGTIVLLTILNGSILGFFGLTHFEGLEWQSVALVGFAISFSSTVFVVKILEDRGEMRARHAQVAIGILIIQDIVAVLFVTLATDKTPEWWALILLGLPLTIPILHKILQRSGHGELLPLAGFFFAFTFGHLFELLGLEAHLGALIIGILLSGHGKSTELAKSMLRFKDIFLIGFFLSIGFTALPTIDMLTVALIIAIALPFKAGLFFLWLTRLKLRGRSSFLAALSLSNYSEFGLIVCSVSVANQLLEKEWLVIIALAVAFSFIFSSLLNIQAHELYTRWNRTIKRFERSQRLAEDQFTQPENASTLVIGMGRVGRGAYDSLHNELDKKVCGVDLVKERVDSLCATGRNIIMADAEDPEFWQHIDLTPIHLILLTLPNHLDILEVNKQIQVAGYTGKIAAIARYLDEEKELLTSGIDMVFNYYEKVGAGFAERTVHLFDSQTE